MKILRSCLSISAGVSISLRHDIEVAFMAMATLRILKVIHNKMGVSS
jgi:hypothetical protein